MAELVPAPFDALVRRVFAELEHSDSIYDLPSRSFYRPPSDLDLSVRFHEARAATPVGPAAGPHTQMTQNILLSWLAGSRILELKTVQIDDQLHIPRPCIDVHNIGYNIEWSQELRIEESLREYAKAWLLIHMVSKADVLGLGEQRAQQDRAGTLFDLSVGYDLAGIQSPAVTNFIRGTLNVADLVDEYRAQVPEAYRHLAEVDVPARMTDCITLSTFHGCPAHQIESIVRYLLDEIGVHVVVKMNPPLLGYERVKQLVCEQLGYGDLRIPESAFEEDLKWTDAVPMVERLRHYAAARELTLGVKLTNTLVVENHREFFETETMYLSGQPLHVIAISILAMIREAFPDLPVSFSAGVDKLNFSDCVALGLVPITTCTDLLRPGGYARLPKYLLNLEKRMRGLGVTDIPSYLELASLDAQQHALKLAQDPRYTAAKNSSVPKKIGSKLELFDCVNCDKCIPVCPNDANFFYTLDAGRHDYLQLIVKEGKILSQSGGVLEVESTHQLATYADFCNECGNCDVFCPEDGGPFIMKPRFFGSRASLATWPDHDGLVIEKGSEPVQLFARIAGLEYTLQMGPEIDEFSDGHIRVSLDAHNGQLVEAQPVAGETLREDQSLSLEPYVVMKLLGTALLDPSAKPNPANAPWIADPAAAASSR